MKIDFQIGQWSRLKPVLFKNRVVSIIAKIRVSLNSNLDGSHRFNIGMTIDLITSYLVTNYHHGINAKNLSALNKDR